MGKGVPDLVRLSNAELSGTAYGTVVLHVAPEAAVVGPLALVCNGEMIELEVADRRLQLLVEDEELARRRLTWQPPQSEYSSGYVGLYQDHVMQADKGADLDFLVGCRGAYIAKPNH